MGMERISTERLQSMLDYANQKAREEDCLRRIQIRAEVSRLQNATRVHVLSAWVGDLC